VQRREQWRNLTIRGSYENVQTYIIIHCYYTKTNNIIVYITDYSRNIVGDKGYIRRDLEAPQNRGSLWNVHPILPIIAPQEGNH
jgi:hypothetical protein